MTPMKPPPLKFLFMRHAFSKDGDRVFGQTAHEEISTVGRGQFTHIAAANIAHQINPKQQCFYASISLIIPLVRVHLS
jgi:hypothetical protein